MSFKSFPVSEAQQVHWGSDIASVRYDAGGLVVKVAREALDGSRYEGLRICFARTYGFRLLDEVDLAQYWVAKGFARGHHVISVLSGGWGSEENERQGYVLERKEWMVVTGNGCLSVFSNEPPVIEDGVFDDEAEAIGSLNRPL